MARPPFTDADLALLLRESDREAPILSEPRPATDAPEPRESLDSLILAGLVSP